MKLNKLKETYDAEFGFDLFRTDRKRHKVYARKIFSYHARLMGFSFQEIGSCINVKHDNVIFYCNTIHTVTDREKEIFNKIVYSLKQKFVPFKIQYSENLLVKVDDMTRSLFIELSTLTETQINDFRETRLKPYLLMLKNKNND